MGITDEGGGGGGDGSITSKLVFKLSTFMLATFGGLLQARITLEWTRNRLIKRSIRMSKMNSGRAL